MNLRRRKGWQLEVGEAELRAMTRDLDEAHREAMPRMNAEASAYGQALREQVHRATVGRRNFLLGVGAIGATLALSGCGGDDTDDATQAPGGADKPASGGGYTGDLKIVAFAAALENEAIVAYTAALDAAGKGALGEVPKAVAEFATVAMKQHQDHAAAWNGVLKTNNLAEITGVPLSTHQATLDALGKVKDVGEVAKLALTLEDQAAATYLLALGAVTDEGGIKTAASIAPVEAMHAAILHFVLGEYPVPVSAIGTKIAADPASFTG
ncbi:MAG: ferritin-like domain-containing protein [Sporichthyaceae bacterium]